MVASSGRKLSFDGKEYPLDFDQCIFVRLRKGNPSWGTIGAGPTVWDPKKASWATKKRDTLEATVAQFRGKHIWVESYFSKRGIDNIILQEYIFQNGDSLYMKGKIENGRIVPFTEHFLEDFVND